MATAVTMPALGESVTEGTVTTWLKNVGDTIAADEPIVEVSTDKVDSEVPSPVAGVLLEILVPEDETVEVGTTIAMIGDASEATSAPAPVAEAPTAPAPVAEAPVAPAPASPIASAPASGTEVLMPALGESVTEGTVTTWLKSVGDAVEADEPLLEVSTDKVDSEVPSPAAGFLAEIRVEEDQTVSVGTVVAVISSEAPGAAPAAPVAPAAATPAPVAPAAPVAPVAPAAATPAPVAPAMPVAPAAPTPVPATLDQLSNAVETAAPTGTPVASQTPAAVANTGYVTPIVRKLAREANIDLATITGTGVGGRIRREDIENAVAAREAAKAPVAPAPVASAPTASAPVAQKREPSPLRGTTEKMSRLRLTIARRMMESLQNSAQLTTVVEVDVTKVAALRARSKDAFIAKHNTKLTFLPFFVKAATEALQFHPKINATIDDNKVTYFDHEHIGIAVDTPRGLLVPVIKDAGTKDIPGIAASINDLAARTRDAKVGPEELTGSTFTITNTGSGGALFDTPVLNSPETAIMGVGTIVKRPMVVKAADGSESVAIRSMVYLSLSYDHRLVDGGDAARYLMEVKKRLEEANFDADLAL
ncbi:2-oxoglutarate dehydrogenase, E2 component, dihydrolipoamide succinyltransferase [Schaalia turicensis ACS-279-V-Col4]|uniref:Dihydrolipoamide acetyltransferase component of pyruvate dehydrogenase complex n=1 Tax=Schaalia turicensis ACS-279-V-Col4 TaxID=883077 RepID=K0YRU4_9ACTO|nr:2-oxoglutarate dehydrogenase, E2 component, dihydrolipoamide succinyltransferase [Schaalia turicensis]EJZ86133.1 2-oxoglutarate dehydrogenase, E2 component, dihydrolipoamide succinyltransferase [Schaalia turicensis ACS-279-V-Col4]QYB15996.1 2-oxoglutarate dehydrogenase, E2 component, dihydrolipoamide succinyltransferase [Schaalia turicensis]